MNEPVNPYATPASLAPHLDYGSNVYHVHGRLIGIGPVAEFPDRCFVTGLPANEGKRYTKKLYFCNSLWVLLIFLGAIGIIIYTCIYYSTRESATACYSLSRKQIKKQRWKCLIGLTISFLILAVSILCINESNNSDDLLITGIIGVALFLVSIIITKTVCTHIRIKRYTNGFSYLTGSGKPFRDYIEDRQAARN